MFSKLMSEISKILMMSLRYFLVFIIVSIAMMSLLTGKFPPPMGKMYDSVKAIQPHMNFAEAVDNMKNIRIQREALVKSLESDKQNSSMQSSIEMMDQGEASRHVQEEKKRLELEIVYLKFKLQNLESENQRLKNLIIDQGKLDIPNESIKNQ